MQNSAENFLLTMGKLSKNYELTETVDICKLTTLLTLKNRLIQNQNHISKNAFASN